MATKKKAKRNLSVLCVRRIRRMIKAVLAEAAYFDQDNLPEGPDCGGACCGVGWAVWLEHPKSYCSILKKASKLGPVGENMWDHSQFWIKRAKKALSLPDMPDYDTLFGSHYSWPTTFRMMYGDADILSTTAAKNNKRAKAFAARWEHFIVTDGKD